MTDDKCPNGTVPRRFCTCVICKPPAEPVKTDLEKDGERYRWLCEFREWPESVNAAFDCSGKVMIDDAIDAAMKAGQ